MKPTAIDSIRAMLHFPTRLWRRRFAACAAAILFVSNANAQLTKAPSDAAASFSLKARAESIAEGVGDYVNQTAPHRSGQVFVFEEYHNSRVGQVQIATMLTRLYKRAGVRRIGLEGAVQSEAPLPTSKFLGNAGKGVRPEVLKDLLRDAEISAAEYAGSALPGMQVWGLENAGEYNVQPGKGGGSELIAILAIAERKLSPEKLEAVGKLLAGKKVEEALSTMKEADPWIKSHLDALKSETFNLVDLAVNIKEIIAEADSVRVQLPPDVKGELNASLNFYQAAEKRSDTMASAAAILAKKNAGTPIAVIIGAAHTQRLLAGLEKEDVSAVVLRALDFKGDNDKLGTVRFDLKSRGFWGNSEPGSLGAILNGSKAKRAQSERKPPPIIGDFKRDGYASAQAAAKIAAYAVRNGDSFPKAILDRIASLPGITVNPNSFEKHGNDVIFSIDMATVDGQSKTVWVRAGTKPVTSAAAKSQTSVDIAFEKLKEAEREPSADGGGDGKEPPNKKTGTGEDGEENPAGKKPNEKRATEKAAADLVKTDVLTNREAKAMFFESLPEAQSHPPISE